MADRGIHETPGPAFELAILRVPYMQRRRLAEIVQVVIAEDQEHERRRERQEAGEEDALVDDRRAQHAGIQDFDGRGQASAEVGGQGLRIVDELSERKRIAEAEDARPARRTGRLRAPQAEGVNVDFIGQRRLPTTDEVLMRLPEAWDAVEVRSGHAVKHLRREPPAQAEGGLSEHKRGRKTHEKECGVDGGSTEHVGLPPLRRYGSRAVVVHTRLTGT